MIDALVFKVANELERRQALELRQDVYRRDLGMTLVDEFDDAAHHLVVCDRTGVVIAASRFVGPQLRPFEVERFVDLTALIGKDGTPAMVGRFCVRRDHRSFGRLSVVLQVGMLKLTYAIAVRHNVTHLVMYALPNMIAFYRGARFRPINIEFYHTAAEATVHLMLMCVKDLEVRISRRDTHFSRLFTSIPVAVDAAS